VSTIHDTIHDTDQVADQVRNLIRVLDGELSGLDIMQRLKLNHKPNFRLEYLQPAIKEKIVEMTIPDKPNSRLQKYRLTSKGKEIKTKLKK
jgi:ATP-dependent DNA helicase RecG